MLPSIGVGLLALFRRIRSIGHTLKSFILRCLLFWPHVLRNLRHIWSLDSRTGPKDVPKENGGQARPSFPRASGACEGYSTIYASRDHNRSSEPHLPLGSGNTEHLSPTVGPSDSQSVLHSPASSRGSSRPGSLHHSESHFPGSSTPFIANADNIQMPLVHHLNTPLTLTHSRATSTQFAGAPRRSRSRSRSRSPSRFPQSHSLPQSSTLESPTASPGHSRPPTRPPSPITFPKPLTMPQPSVPDISGTAQIPDVAPTSHDTSEEYRRPAIKISPPSRQTTEAETQSSIKFPQPPFSIQEEDFQIPTASTEPSALDPLDGDTGNLGLEQGNPRHSSESLRPNTLVPFPSHPHSMPYKSQVTLVDFPIFDESGNWSDGKRRTIGLMHSDQVSRYVNKGNVPREESKFRLGQMEVNLPKYSLAKRPKGWEPATHPGGAVYFYHAEWKILTDVYMYDPKLSPEIQAFAVYLHRKPTTLPTKNYDLVLDVINKDDEIVWAYYYVDHDTKTLFWQDGYECGDSLLSEVPGVEEASHVKLRLESLYWVHWSLYPTGPNWRTFPDNASKELLGALLSSGIDSLTSKVSTSLYSVPEIESMRDFIKEAKDLGPENPHVITSVARLLSFYAHWRFIHFHGQKTPRQDRHKSIYEGNNLRRTYLIKILSPILFFFPDVHLRELEKLWTDKIIVEALWRDFMQKLVSEWTDFVLYSTVMLAANVGFLAIPGVITVPSSPNAWIDPSPAQITSSISLVFSIGSIITGLLLIRRNRTMMTKDPRNAWYYLHGMNWRVVGLEPLAIVFSLNYALLMWSAWGFFVALLLFSFRNMPRDIWIPVGTASGIVTFLILWCIANTWDPKEQEDEPEWPQVDDSTQPNSGSPA